MKTIGIDIGTTSISGVIYDSVEERIICSRTVDNGSFIVTNNEWERVQDVEFIIHRSRELLAELMAEKHEIEAIGITGQMHGILYLDKDGHAISNLYTWQDGRGNTLDENGRAFADTISERTGYAAATGFGLVTHIYNSKKGIVPKECTVFATIPDYLGMVLTGRSKPIMHASMAASLGVFNIKTLEFDRAAIASLGIDTSILPEVIDDIQTIGTYEGIPVTVALGDNQASFLGTVGFSVDTMLLNMGTGGQISVMSEIPFAGGGVEARPYISGKYLLAGSSLCGGRAYAILENFFRAYVKEATGRDEQQYDVLARLAERGAHTTTSVKAETTFNGTRTEPLKKAEISGLTEDNFLPESLVIAILSGMVEELYTYYDSIHQGTEFCARRIMASGNGIRKNAVLQQLFAEKFKAGLELTGGEEAACGAARCYFYTKD